MALWPLVVALSPSRPDLMEDIAWATRVHLVRPQQQVRLDPLAQNPTLDWLALYEVPHLTDLNDLANSGLERLRLVQCPRVTDYSALETMEHLKVLHVAPLGLEPMSRIDRHLLTPVDLSQVATAPDLRSLFLHTASLTSVPALGTMGPLEALHLQGCEFDQGQLSFDGPGHLEYLAIGPYELPDLRSLRPLCKVDTLNLSRCRRPLDLKGLEELAALTSLSISGDAAFSHLSALSRLKELETLELWAACGPYDVGFLYEMQRLSTLGLSAWAMDLSILGHLAELTHLTLYNQPDLEDLAFLKPDQRLESLTLHSLDNLQTLAGIRSQTQLNYVDISEAPELESLAPLEACTKLQTLEISGCHKLTDLEFLESTPEIEELSISACGQLQHIDEIGELRRLRRLYLDSLPGVTDLSPLARCVALEDASFSLTPELVTDGTYRPPDLQPLHGLKNLRHLDCWGAELQSAETLAVCAAAAGDWRFIKEQGDAWLELLPSSPDPVRTAGRFLDAFAAARQRNADGGLLERLLALLGQWEKAAEEARKRMEIIARQRANGDRKGGEQ